MGRTTPLVRFLSDDGTSSGTKDAIGNYATPTDFFLEAEENQYLLIARLMVSIEDVGQPSAMKYGFNLTLTNGIYVLVEYADGSPDSDMVNGNPIKTNADWGRFAYDMRPQDFKTGDNAVQARWEFRRFIQERRENPYPGILLYPGDKLICRLQDDFSNLVHHFICAEGEVLDGVIA